MHLQFSDGITDDSGRQITLRGVNIDGMAKMPMGQSTFTFGDPFWDGDNVSFAGRPFSLEHAPEHFERIKGWGFNTIRYIFTWEAIEHAGPGKYDTAFIEFTVSVLRIAVEHGLLIFLDPHQDVWGRFSGGSGAPLWTYYACGLEPRNFEATRAAIVQNVQKDPHALPKMLWPTNYYRMACMTVFTLFFGGERLAPKCTLDGVNIQQFLQTHFLNSCLQLYRAVEAAGLFAEGHVFGIENMNEPNMGLLGFGNINKIPHNQNLRLGSTPTAFQSMLLASGHKQTLESYSFGTLGPKLNGQVTFDPQCSVWLDSPKYDEHYGWTRGPEWQLGECVWAQHGVWDPRTQELLKPHYFGSSMRNEIDEAYAVDEFFLPYWALHYTTLRRELPPYIWLLCQPPAMFPPPKLIGTELIDERVIYAPHFYDGLTLMLKRWSALWNVDSLGFLRGHYKIPLFALRVGEGAIRSGIANQLRIMSREGKQNMGPHVPLLMSETGVPMDMNHKEAFENQNYTAQIKALDAIASALELNLMNFTWWCYSTDNSHELGDHWNHEDFSFLGETGPRAEIAYVRPAPIAVAGRILANSYELSSDTFRLTIEARDCEDSEKVTEVYLPTLQFPDYRIHVSSGNTTTSGETLLWRHPAGKHHLKVYRRRGWCCIQ